MRRALPILTLVIVLALAAAGLADLGAPAAVLAQGPTPGMAAVGARVALNTAASTAIPPPAPTSSGPRSWASTGAPSP